MIVHCNHWSFQLNAFSIIFMHRYCHEKDIGLLVAVVCWLNWQIILLDFEIRAHCNLPCKCLGSRLMTCMLFVFQGPIIPGAHSIERCLIEEQLHIIIYSNFLERKDWYGIYFLFFCFILLCTVIIRVYFTRCSFYWTVPHCRRAA